ncbi:MAG: hypothetical protein LAN64_10710 [Acidobacteriia bacterium]|nr:hypothetical protein [Terriglobia bacterium]
MNLYLMRASHRRWQAGVTLLETMIATSILLVGVVGLMGLLSVSVLQNANQGENATRTTEYAQDKMESLMALTFNDGSTDTRTYPAAATGGTGLGGTMAASATVGGLNAGSPVSSYVDYLNSTGTLSTSSTGAVYIRVWRITTDSTARVKTITVVAAATRTNGASFAAARTTLSCYKVNLQ